MCSYPDTLKGYSIKIAHYKAECQSKFPLPITEDLYINFQSISNSTFNSSLNNLTSNSGNILMLNINIAEGSILSKLR